MRVLFKIILLVAIAAATSMTICWGLRINDQLFSLLMLSGWFVVGLIILIGCLTREFICDEGGVSISVDN